MLFLFEFCLHEMADPAQALGHAKGMAPEVVVIDHDRESRWAFLTAEENKIAAGWKSGRGEGPQEASEVRSGSNVCELQRAFGEAIWAWPNQSPAH